MDLEIVQNSEYYIFKILNIYLLVLLYLLTYFTYILIY